MARSIVVKFVGETRDLEGAFARAEGRTHALGKAVGLAGVALAGVLAVGLVKSVGAATAFESSMEQIQTQTGGSTAEVKKMSAALLGMAASVGKTPEELSKGLYHVESAGFRGAKALDILKLAAEGAAVGHSDLEQTTTALVAAQRSGIAGLGDMSHAMGSLNAIVGAGNMRMDDLTAALGTGVLPAAKAFGLNISDVGAALATMTSNGIPAVNAATGLRMMFMSMAAPTSKAAGLLKDVGLSSTDLADTIRNKGLFAALTELKTHMETAGLTATEQGALLAGAFGRKSSTGLLTLIGNLKDMKVAQDQVTTGASTFGANWEETQKTAAFASERLHAAISAIGVEIGSALLPAVATATTKVADFLAKLSGAQTFHAKLVVVWEGIAGITASITAALAQAWNGTDVGTIMSRNTSGADMNKGIKGMLDKIDWAAVGSGVAKDMVSAIGRGISKVSWGSVLTAISKAYDAIIGALAQAFLGASYALGLAIEHGIIKGVSGLSSAIGRELGKVIAAISGLPGRILAALGNLGSLLYGAGRALIQGLIGGIKSMASSAASAAADVAKSAYHAVTGFLGIHSPSTLFHQLGVLTMLGYINGINDMAPKARAAMGFVAADARRGMGEVIVTIEGAWVKVAQTLSK
ncbi:MAG TPA: phage tail tape measure protein, partial [Dehalococcoidia bacterium]